MREIKLRAWDTQRKMFVPEGSISFNFYGDCYWEVNPNSLEYIGDSVHNGEPQRGRFIIQQYTGLNDRRGKEIYEGDICKRTTDGIHYDAGEILFVDCSFKWRGQVRMPIIDIATHKQYEVVGHIYKNTELLGERVAPTQ